jgi:hypothetical protein
MQMTKDLLVLGVVCLMLGCVRLPPAAVPARLSLRELPGGAVVVVKVKSPWYAPRWLIVRKFRESVPEYQALQGLERKAFSFAQADGAFGGVYLWSHRAQAEAHFNDAWHERVRRLRGTEGDVRVFDVNRVLDGPLASVEEGPMVVAMTAGKLERYAAAAGLRWASEGAGVVVSAWQSRSEAERFFAASESVEWFDTPVAIDNRSAR